MMLEKYLERKLVNAVKDAGGIAIKLPANLYRGIPDRLVLIKGKGIFIEMKQKGKELRPEQKVWKVRLEKNGFLHFVIDSNEAVNNLISLLKGF